MSCFLDLQSFFFSFSFSSFSGLSPVASYLSRNVMPKIGRDWGHVIVVQRRKNCFTYPTKDVCFIHQPLKLSFKYIVDAHLVFDALLVQTSFCKTSGKHIFFFLYRWESLLNWLYITFIFILKDRKKKKSALGVHLSTFVKTILSFLLIV